jgi:hypothetical protein
MLQSRHFAGKPLIGKGLKQFSTTLYCGARPFSAHHLGEQQQNFKKRIGRKSMVIRFSTLVGQAIITGIISQSASALVACAARKSLLLQGVTGLESQSRSCVFS